MKPSASDFASGICTNFSFAEKLIMVIGGWWYNGNDQTNDIEIVAPDSTTTPDTSCLSERSPFPFGAIERAVGGTTVPGEFIKNINS